MEEGNERVAQLETVFSRANDAIFILDPERDRIIEANPRACSMLGYAHEELLSVCISVVHPGEMSRMLSFARSVYAHQRGWTDELSCVTKTGHVIPTEISASVVDLGGRPAMIAIVRDITDRKREIALPRGAEVNGGNSSAAASCTLPEPLSHRELEVLNLIDAGLSNCEICEQMFISLNTLRSHTRSLYRKLDVHSRTQAVSTARRQGLIGP